MEKPSRFEIRLPPELNEALDEWRSKQKDIPNKAESARRLIRLALEKENIPVKKSDKK